ncbi:MAG: hypothetical protein JSW58_10575 [Candidatus Latescibacterota bacterium]|nr:MAG: hypothetical protein JSW58_10575 [Candidatus Latescibacterota bacterium]
MNKRKIGATVRLILAIGCFVMAVLSFLGVGTTDEPNGRWIFGLLWTGVGILWILRIMMSKEKDRSRDRADGREA